MEMWGALVRGLPSARVEKPLSFRKCRSCRAFASAIRTSAPRGRLTGNIVEGEVEATIGDPRAMALLQPREPWRPKMIASAEAPEDLT